MVISTKVSVNLMQNLRCYCTVVQGVRKNTITARLEYFSKLLGVSKHAANQRLKLYDEIKARTLSEIDDSFQTLDNLAMDKAHIQGNIEVLAISAETIKQRHALLSEFGFTPQVPHLIRYSDILKSAIDDLVYQGYLPSSVDPLKTLADTLACPQSIHSIIFPSCEPQYRTLPLKTLREMILLQILAHHLELPEKVVSDFLKKGRRLQKSSLTAIAETIRILKDDFGLTNEAIVKTPLLVTVNPSDLKDLQSICGSHQLDWRDLSARMVLLLLSKPKDVDLICKYLEDYGITPELISTTPSVLLLSPKYVREGLAVLRSWPEFHLLRCKPQILTVLKNYKKADIRMRYLKKARLHKFNLTLLLADDDDFQKQMNGCDDKHSGSEISAFVADRLDMASERVVKGLCRHPRFKVATLVEVQATLAFLFCQGFDHKAISKTLPLLLHPKNKVATSWAALPHQPFAQPFSDWHGSPNLLQLLLYFVEMKDYVHFKPVEMPSK